MQFTLQKISVNTPYISLHNSRHNFAISRIRIDRLSIIPPSKRRYFVEPNIFHCGNSGMARFRLCTDRCVQVGVHLIYLYTIIITDTLPYTFMKTSMCTFTGTYIYMEKCLEKMFTYKYKKKLDIL